jgi:serine/threonine protein kinase
VAAALEATHARGIVHRDLKPGNIRITPTDSVKVLDFGIAKALLRDVAAETTMVAHPESSTEIGIVVGTPAYMSPEQADGRPVDARADVWAFACVLYEALTGIRAFGATGRSAVLSAAGSNHTDWGALPVATPPSIRELLRRCLARDVEQRLSDIGAAREVIESALAGMSDPAAPTSLRARQSVAVLPFDNMSADPENQFFSDGLSEDLINALTRLPALHVASRTSAFRFRNSNLDVRQIGEQLGVGAVVEGSVRRAGSGCESPPSSLTPAMGTISGRNATTARRPTYSTFRTTLSRRSSRRSSRRFSVNRQIPFTARPRTLKRTSFTCRDVTTGISDPRER